MKKKSEALDKFKLFMAEVVNQTNFKLKTLRADNGEYVSNEFKKYCVDNGIKQKYTIPHTRTKWSCRT